MSSKETNPAFQTLAEEIIKEVLATGVNPLALERQHVDLLLHYLNPTIESGAISVAHAQEVIHNGIIVTRLLRGISGTQSAS